MGSKTYVSTVTYPLGNDEEDERIDLVQQTVLNAVLQSQNVAEKLTDSFLTGGASKLRRAYAYARDKYTQGLPSANTLYLGSPDQAVILDVLMARESADEIYLTTAVVQPADYAFWAERWLTEKYGYDRFRGLFAYPPNGVDPEADVSYDIENDGTIRVLLMNPDNSSVILSYRPRDLQSHALYLHVVYQVLRNYPDEISRTTRSTELGDTPGLQSNTVTTTEIPLGLRETETKVEFEIEGGQTTVVTTVRARSMSRPQYFMYRVGAGDFPQFDDWVQPGSDLASPYFPAVPLRIDNVDILTAANEKKPLYQTSEKLLKIVGVGLEDLGDKLRTNKNIKEIDYAFLQFGVALNSKTPECKAYIFRFMEMLQSHSAVSSADFAAWEAAHAQTTVAMGAVQSESSSDPEDPGGLPVRQLIQAAQAAGGQVGYNSPPTNILRLRDPDMNQRTWALDIMLKWRRIDKTQHSGVIFPGAKAGDCKVGTNGTSTSIVMFNNMVIDNSEFWASRQIDEDTYETITVGGLVFINNVYKDKTVEITAYDAMHKKDEEGFVLPLHTGILKQLGVKRTNQLFYDCTHLVLNCYQVVKKKWYQKGLFKIIVIIVAIIIAVVSWGTASSVSTGMVGTVMGGLAAVGITGILAFIIANLLIGAAISILLRILTPVLTQIFGEKWGRVIGAVLAIVASNYAGGGTLSSAFEGGLTAVNVINAATAVLNIASAYVQGAMAELNPAKQLEDMRKDYEEGMDKVKELQKELNLGDNSNLIDIQGFIEAAARIMEDPTTFFNRTLMTGADICDITLGQVENFCDVGLLLPNTR